MRIECRNGEIIIPAEGIGPSYREDSQGGLRKKVSLADYDSLLWEEMEKMCDKECAGGSECKVKGLGRAGVQEMLVESVKTKVLGQ